MHVEHGGAEGGAEEGELDEVLGADLGVGADVEDEDRFDRRGERTASAGRCTPFSRRRPKVAAAIVAPVEPRLTIAAALPLGDVARGADDRGLFAVAHRLHGVVVVADPFGGRDHLDPVDPVEAERALRPEDPYADAVGGRAAGALGKNVETLLRPVTIQGDRRRAALRHGRPESAVVTVGSVTLWETTSRPA